MNIRALPEPERWVVPLAAYLALASLAWTQTDPAGRAEGAFLSLLVCGVLAVLAALGGRGSLAATALLATATTWIAYQGPSRGAVVSLILLGGLAVSAGRTLFDAAGRPRRGEGLDPGVTVPLALGLQLMMRGDLLLAELLAVRTLVSLLVLPAVAGCAASVLAGRFGASRALLAGGLASVLAPGWTLTSTFALAALAAGVLATDEERPGVLRGAAVAGLLALPLWHLPKGLLFAVAGLAFLGRRSATGPLALLAVAAVAVLSPQSHAPLEAVRLWLGALVLVPGAVLAMAGPAAGRRETRRWRVRLGTVLALAGAMVSPAPEAMAAGVAALALGLPAAGAAFTLQRLWGAFLVLGTAVFGAYPWVRQDPRGDLLALLGWREEIVTLAALLVLVPGLGLLLDRWRRRAPRWAPRPLPVAGLLLGWALVSPIVPTQVLLTSYEPIVLDAGTEVWEREIEPRRVSGLALDSNLAGGVRLAAGTPVAVVELLGADARVLGEWTLAAGRHTAEWASSRGDLAGLYGVSPPAPWLSFVAPGGDFFGRRFRSRFETSAPEAASAVRIRRAGGLPAAATLSIYRLELRR